MTCIVFFFFFFDFLCDTQFNCNYTKRVHSNSKCQHWLSKYKLYLSLISRFAHRHNQPSSNNFLLTPLSTHYITHLTVATQLFILRWHLNTHTHLSRVVFKFAHLNRNKWGRRRMSLFKWKPSKLFFAQLETCFSDFVFLCSPECRWLFSTHAHLPI